MPIYKEMGTGLLADDENPEGRFVLLENSNFAICPTYPAVMFEPKSVSQAQLIASSKYRTKNRMPAMTYFHEENGCSIWRSSQPKMGLMGKTCKEDIYLFNEIGLVNGTHHKI